MGAGVDQIAMSKEHNTTKSSATEGTSDSINRRSFVRAFGAAGTAVIGFTGVSAANEGDVQTKTDSVDVEEITGRKKQKIANKAHESKEYDILMDAIVDDGFEVSSQSENVYKISNNKSSFHFASFIIEDGDPKTSINIGIPVGPSKTRSKAVISKYKNGKPTTVDEYIIGNNIHTLEQYKSSMGSNSPRDIKQTTHENGDTTKISSDLSMVWDSTHPRESNDDITTQQACALDWMGCGMCKSFVNIMNNLGCGIGSAAACSVLVAAIGPLGAGACGGGVAVVCSIMADVGNNPSRVCNYGCAC